MTSFYSFPDSLVYKIIEYDNVNYGGNVDNVIYLFYDKNIQKFVIRGKRQYDGSCVYSLQCSVVCELVNFIGFLIGNNKFSIVLYNYDNLPQTSDDITFDFLHKNDDNNNELYGYDNNTFNKKKLTKYFKILNHIYN